MVLVSCSLFGAVDSKSLLETVCAKNMSSPMLYILYMLNVNHKAASFRAVALLPQDHAPWCMQGECVFELRTSHPVNLLPQQNPIHSLFSPCTCDTSVFRKLEGADVFLRVVLGKCSVADAFGRVDVSAALHARSAFCGRTLPGSGFKDLGTAVLKTFQTGPNEKRHEMALGFRAWSKLHTSALHVGLYL